MQMVALSKQAKIESFLNDVTYRNTVEFSANFNTRLCVERRLRLPFLDPQTGVAQSHSHLFMERKQRMPGFRVGQVFTYPAARWRKSRRQYLNKLYRFPDRPFQAFRKDCESLNAGTGGLMAACNATNMQQLTAGADNVAGTADVNGALAQHEESSSLGATGGGDTSDSKDSQVLTQQQQQQQPKADEQSKQWLYDDMDMNDVDSLEEPKSPADDEYDYDPRYGSKKRRKRRVATTKRATGTSLAATVGGVESSSGGGGGASTSSGRRRAPAARNRALLDPTFESPESGELLNISGGRRSRGSGSRGRRRTKAAAAAGQANSGSPLSPGPTSEPPSFESAAAAVAVGIADDGGGSAHLHNYRKYL